jgi:hypothetical protein
MGVGSRSAGRSRRAAVRGAALLALAAVGLADQVTGAELGFYVFYFIPISIVAWRVGLADAVAMALAATFVWYGVDSLAVHSYSSEWIRSWNTLVRLTSFLLIGVMIARGRIFLAREQALNIELSHALAQVRQLSGLLPICASCKNIRNDEGYWERVEKYVADRSEADFTHSICPVCEVQLYGEDAAAEDGD